MSSANNPDTFEQTDAASRRGDESAAQPARDAVVAPKEIGGPKGPDPTRFGDWERNGRCIDF